MAQSNFLQPFTWQNRVLLIYAGQPDNEALATQQSFYEKDTEAYEERDLLVFTILNGEIRDEQGKKVADAGEVIRDFSLGSQPFEVLLIGKDGGVKLRQAEPLTNDRLFAVIDAMPMRKREMREKG